MWGWVSDSYRWAFGALTGPIREGKKELMIKEKLLHIKEIKRTRDIQLSSKVAALRDRVWWMVAFYTTMGAVSLGRMAYLRQFSPLPLNVVPYVLVPFVVGYQADFAYGTKADRINDMAARIRAEEDFWFNKPIELPVLLKEPYHQMMRETNEQLAALGAPPEKDWAM